MTKRDAQKEDHWRKMVLKQEKSGASIRQFCKVEQLSEASFYSWRREIRMRDRERGSTEGARSGKRSRQGRGQSTNANGRRQRASQRKSVSPFIPVQVIGNLGVIELVHPRGYTVRIPSAFDHECLQRVLELLDGEGQG